MTGAFSRRVLLASAAALSASGGMLPDVQLPRKVRVAILGLDGHVSEILTPLPRLPDVTVVAVSHPDKERLERWATNPLVKGADRYPDWREMLRQTEADVVAVCNDNGERAEAVLACLQRGLHVIAEKPLALNTADLLKIQTESEERHRRVGLLLPMRYLPEYQMMRQVVAEGLVGEIVQMDAQKSYKGGARADWYLHHASYGGTIPWLAPHMIDLMRFTSGRDFRETSGYAANIGAPSLGDMENVTASIFRLDNGGTATLRMDYLRPEAALTHGDDRLRLAGLSGVVEFEERTGVTLVTSREKPKQLPDLPVAGSVFVSFLESLYAGKPNDLPLAEIVRVSEIVIGAEIAAHEHRIIRI